MKKITYFYLEFCPHCRKASRILEECLQDERFQQLEIERIEESKQPEIANQYDYYYVPCFWVDGKKVKEGTLEKEDVLEVLELASS